MQSFIRPLLIAAGSLFVVLALVGIFVPILPTTPFLLLAAACYARSSDRFLHWLLHNPWFGTYIRDYREGRGMPQSTKALTLIALWATLALSAAFAVDAWWIRAALIAVGIAVSLHLLRIKTSESSREGAAISGVHKPPAPDET